MMAFPAHGFVLLAMPKCASTTLESALAPHASLVIDRPPGLKHLGTGGFARRIAPRLAADGYQRDDYELVTMFRDPVRWLESWWRYRARPSLADDANSTRQLDFEEFALAYLAGDPDAPTPRGRPGQFITQGGVVEVDRVLAVERPETWTAWFRQRLGAELAFERRNVSSAPVSGTLTEGTRGALVDYFAPEYAVCARLADTGEWAGARGTALAVPSRPRSAQNS